MASSLTVPARGSRGPQLRTLMATMTAEIAAAHRSIDTLLPRWEIGMMTNLQQTRRDVCTHFDVSIKNSLSQPAALGSMRSMADILFEPLRFRNLTVKNRIFRSNISGRFDNYDGSGNQARINWETKFARGGVGAIISSFVPVHIHGRIMPNYATIDRDERIPFWRKVGEAVHQYDCKFILQLSHGGRQRDINGIEYPRGLPATAKADPWHGFECDAMPHAQITEVVGYFAEGARRAREAGLDGVE